MDLSSFDFLEKQNNNMLFESVYDRSCFNCLYHLNGSPTVAVLFALRSGGRSASWLKFV